jgi:curved DNA-binding protein CbpA
MKAVEKIIYLAGSTASNVELLTAQVKHGALINGISSPVPGTAMYQPPTSPFIKSGPLKDFDSYYNLAGFSSTQCIENSARGHKAKRRKCKVYALMPRSISKRSANGDINKPVSNKVYNRYRKRKNSPQKPYTCTRAEVSESCTGL